MSGAVLSFCAMAIAARELLQHTGVFEILFFRTGVALLIVLAAALFWMSVIQTPFCLVAALPGWSAPELRDLPWIVVIGRGSFTAHYCLTRSMRFADASVVVPVDFFRLPLIAVVGAVFYAEPFDPAVIAGAAVIFAGTWFSLSRESRRLG